MRLASVGRIIRECWPAPKQLPPAAVLENARDRGASVDELLTSYVRGTLHVFPAGTRRDAIALFEKARAWYDKQGFGGAEAQVLLGGDDHCGVADLRIHGLILDLKSTYDVSDTHIMQVAAYASLDSDCDDYDILQVTERHKEARLTTYGQREVDDWRTMLSHWRMVERRGGWKA